MQNSFRFIFLSDSISLAFFFCVCVFIVFLTFWLSVCVFWPHFVRCMSRFSFVHLIFILRSENSRSFWFCYSPVCDWCRHCCCCCDSTQWQNIWRCHFAILLSLALNSYRRFAWLNFFSLLRVHALFRSSRSHRSHSTSRIQHVVWPFCMCDAVKQKQIEIRFDVWQQTTFIVITAYATRTVDLSWLVEVLLRRTINVLLALCLR